MESDSYREGMVIESDSHRKGMVIESDSHRKGMVMSHRKCMVRSMVIVISGLQCLIRAHHGIPSHFVETLVLTLTVTQT